MVEDSQLNKDSVFADIPTDASPDNVPVDDHTMSAEEVERAGFVERIKEAWRDTVGAYATDADSTKNLFGRLVDFGTLSREEAMKIVTDVGGRIEDNRRELDKRVDDSIHRATVLFAVPSPSVVKALEAQVESLEQRIASLEEH